MDLTPYIASLREDLTTTASAGDESTRRSAAVLAAALEPAVRLTLMTALSDLAAEVTAALDTQVVEVRLDGRDVQVVVTDTSRRAEREERETAPPPPPPPTGEGNENISRMTVRLFEELKGRAEQAAQSQGVSLNTFVQQAVQGALHNHPKFRAWTEGTGWSQDSEESGGRKQDKGGEGHLRGWVTG
jgi:HicB-like protein involved in pilus formation